MNGKPNKKDRVEISSDQLKAELIEIKERVGALETIASISNRSVVEAYVRTHLTSEKGKLIMKECAEPRTREHLISNLEFASAQALDYHLNPLRENDLIRQHFDDDGTQTFEWSNLFKRLPKKTLKEILDGSD
jgi:DNA-binding transcriptional ArsR family regulator